MLNILPRNCYFKNIKNYYIYKNLIFIDPPAKYIICTSYHFITNLIHYGNVSSITFQVYTQHCCILLSTISYNVTTRMYPDISFSSTN